MKAGDAPDPKRISALRVDLYGCNSESAASQLKPYAPDTPDFAHLAWIPQTLGDQIWVLFEFFSEEDRITWESTLPEHIRKWLDRNLIKHALPYGWHVRNMNGFY